MKEPTHHVKRRLKQFDGSYFWTKPADFYGWLGSGVVDCKGREIYEGDIVKYVGEDFLGVAPAGTTSTVIFAHGGFWAFTLALVNFNDGGLEVVGHIAEEINYAEI